MEIIAHRRNTIAELVATPIRFGIEIDIRTLGDRLIVQHDPFVGGVEFEQWLDHYEHGRLILNVKEEGLEERLSAEMARRGLTQYFFLDQSFPFLLKTAARGERRCAVRVSEFESIETALALRGRIEWVWVDCFSTFPLSLADANALTDAGFRLCLVSPELQGRDSETQIPLLRELLDDRKITPDAICTKRPDLWA